MKNKYFLIYLLLMFIGAGCSEDKDLEIDSKKNETVTNQDSIASLYKVFHDKRPCFRKLK